MRFAQIRLVKFAVNSAMFALIYLTWRLVTGHLDWGLALGTALLSAFWLGLTALRLRQLFTTYFDILSRLEVLLPLLLGLCLSVTSALVVQHWTLYAIAVAEIIGWLAIYIAYRVNRTRYIKQGHGPLPKDCWLNPPDEALKPFDIVLFSGRMAARVMASVGHGETVVRKHDGTMASFTALMEAGVVIRNLAEVTSRQLKSGHYVVLRLKQPVTDEMIAKAWVIAQQMLQDNIAWRDRVNARRAWMINRLPLPKSWRESLIKRFHCTGYDWSGLLIGARARNRWTCVGVCLELYARLGIKTAKYGTGILGLGTGLLNPINPVRFLADPSFHLLSIDDKAAWDARSA